MKISQIKKISIESCKLNTSKYYRRLGSISKVISVVNGGDGEADGVSKVPASTP